MKRLALVLTTALFGTGCMFHDDDDCDPSVTIEWTSFRTAEGDLVGCSTSLPAIVAVRIVVNDRVFAEVGCSGGRGTVSVPSGSNLLTIEALDASGAIIYRDEFFVDSNRCGNQVVASQPAEGFVNVQYTLPADACVSPGPSFMWVLVRDDIAGEIAADSAADPEAFACGSPLSFRLATGNYTLLDTHEVVPSNGGYAAVSQDCTDRQLVVGAAATTNVPSDLFDTNSFCP